jgi:penicillin-binding protein 1A
LAQKKKKSHQGLLTVFLIFLMTSAICAVAFAIYVHIYINPNVDIDVSSYGMNFSSMIYYQDSDNGEYKELQELHGSENRIWCDYDDMPEDLGNAFVAIEDQRFYSHHGVDWKRTVGAVVNWVLPIKSSAGGGSTITQQLVKNLTDDNDYSVKRKITEILRALHLEKQLDDKQRILELYMNTIYLGHNSYGVQTASMRYFDKDVSELNLAECALLAGITNNPSYYDPLRKPENAKSRQELILDSMEKQGYITAEQCQDAKNYKLVYKSEESQAADSEPYSYFVDTVIRDVTNDLIAQKGYSREYANELVTSGGLKIYATVDMDIQKIMENVYNKSSNFPSYQKNGSSLQSAMVLLDPYTGDLKGIVGGRNPSEKASLDLNRATQSQLSPGSSLKPLSVYGPAVDLGVISPNTVYEDSPFMKLNGQDWPRNENRTYTGNVTIATAVAKSINTVAVKVLDDITPEKSYEYLTERFGFTTLSKSDINYSPLALGSCSVTVREMAAGYSAFVNDGMYSKCRSYTKVLDSNGGVLLSNNDEPTIAFDNEDTSYVITDLLENAVKNGTGKAARLSNMATAGKTGTTSSNKDRWFVGYTPYYVAACWVGYDEGYGIPNMSYNPAARLWKNVMAQVHADLPEKEFETSDTYVKGNYKKTGSSSSSSSGSKKKKSSSGSKSSSSSTTQSSSSTTNSSTENNNSSQNSGTGGNSGGGENTTPLESTTPSTTPSTPSGGEENNSRDSTSPVDPEA